MSKTQWTQIIKEDLGVSNPSTLSWLSEYAENHALYESVQQGGSQGIFSTPMSTLGLAGIHMPGVDGSAYKGFNGVAGAGMSGQFPGSGDIPVSGISMSLEVAAQTIGFELVPVIPSKGPMMLVQYQDYPYGGGKLGRFSETAIDGREDKPIYIKISSREAKVYDEFVKIQKAFDAVTNREDVAEFALNVEAGDLVLHGLYIGKSRIDGGIIIRVKDAHEAADVTKKVSIGDVFRKDPAGVVLKYGKDATASAKVSAYPDLISAAADHIQGFSNFVNDGSSLDNLDPMTREQNETGTGNTIGARTFTKMIQMGSYEVTGSVTRQQLQDLPAYGIDVVGGVLEAMQNELSQAINNRILDRLFKLGTTNAINQKRIQNVDLNLWFDVAANAAPKDLTTFASFNRFVGLNGEKILPGTWLVPNATQNTSAENFMTHQRRLATRCLVAANVIHNVSRFGRGNFVVLNTQLGSALQDNAGFSAAPMVNTLAQDGSQGLYFAGTLAGLNVYIEPNMTFDDTRVLVGRKGTNQNGKVTPGLVFVPYILCDTVSITAEGTMAPKMLCNSRFALAEVGFHPEQSYLTFMVDSSNGNFLI